jgi:hypothetical protein
VTLETVVPAAMGALTLAAAIQPVLKTLRLQRPALQLSAWTAVLMASLAMPALAPFASATARAWLPHLMRDWSGWLTGLYVAVAALLLLRLLRGLLLSWRMLRIARPLAATWATTNTSRTSMLRTSPLRTSTWIGAPVTVGRHVLLPAECVNWDARKRRAIITHQAAHAARGDFYVLILSQLHCAVFWFSPHAWWLHRQLAALVELASDDAAIAELGDGPYHAAILRDVARLPRPPFLGVTMARPATLRQRVARIVTQQHSNSQSPRNQQRGVVYHEANDNHPVARGVHHRRVVQLHARLRHEDERQVLHVV